MSLPAAFGMHFGAATPIAAPPILELLGIDGVLWSETIEISTFKLEIEAVDGCNRKAFLSD